MANYEFTVKNHFQPFTFQEMLLPWVTYKDVYDKTSESIATLQNKADVFKYLADSIDPNDAEAKALYENYANALAAEAAEFSKHGLNMNIQRDLFNLKGRYSGEIGMLEQAQKRKEAADAIKQQMLAKDPSLYFATPNYTLSQFLGEKSPNTYAISGDLLYAKGAAAGKTEAGRLVTTDEGKKYMGDHYIDMVTRAGYTKEAMDAFRMNASNIPELRKIADDILRANGVLDNLKGRDLENARQQVLNGIADGAATATEHKLYENKEMMSLKEREALKIEQAKLALSQAELAYKMAELSGKGGSGSSSKGGSGGGDNVTFDYTPRPVLTTKEMEKRDDDINKWKEYSQYFDKDSKGNWRMNKAGKDRYDRGTRYSGVVTGATSGLPHDGLFKDDDFISFVRKHGLTGMVTKNQYSQPGGIIDQYIDSLNGATDLTEAHEFTRGASDNNTVGSLLSRLSNNEGKLMNYERKKRGNTYTIESTGKYVDLSNITPTDIQSATMVWGIHGNFLEVKVAVGKSDKKKTETIIVPLAKIDSNVDHFVNGNLGEIRKIDNWLKKNNLGEDALYTYKGVEYPAIWIKQKLLNSAGDNFMQMLRKFEMKKTEVEPSINQ